MSAKNVPNPFEDDGAPPAPAAEPKEEVQVDLAADDDGDDIDDEAPRQTREEKKRARTWMNREDRERLEEEVRQSRQRQEALSGQLEALVRMQQEQLRRQPPAAPQEDPIDSAVNAKLRERDLIAEGFQAKVNAGTATAEDRRKAEEEVRRIDMAVVDLRAERIVAQRMANQAPAQNPQAQMIQTYLTNTYPDIMLDERKRGYAQLVHQQAAFRNPQTAASREVLDAVMLQTRRDLGGGEREREPDPSLSARLTGFPRGAQARGGGDRFVTLTKEEKRNADMAYAHLPEAARYKKYAVEVKGGGKKA